MQIVLLRVSNTQLIVIPSNWFSISVNDQPFARDWKYICYVWLSKGAIVHPLMLLNVNTYANSIIESSFAFMMFMELQMNVYLPYSFNCWRKWMCILRKWTAKGVNIFNYGANSLVSLEWKENIKYLGDLIDSKWSRTHTFHLLHLRLASL